MSDQYQYNDGYTVYGQAARITKLEADNARLRAALADLCVADRDDLSNGTSWVWQRAAAALNGTRAEAAEG